VAFELEFKIEHAIAGTVAHLGKSGLAIEDFPDGDIVPVTRAMAEAQGHAAVPGYLIIFRGPDGKLTGFERQRNLSGKGGKELQKAATGSHVYFPVIEGVDWQKLAPGSVIYICESVIKTMRTVKEGVNAIGINGCSAFKSTKTGQFQILDDFRRIDWKRLNLTARILFDSNVRDNPRVMYASLALAYQFSALGAQVDMIKLPHAISGEQQGIDDYLEAGEKFGDLATEKIPYIEVLGEFNERYAWMRHPSGILDLEDNVLLNRRDWLEGEVVDRKMLIKVAEGKSGKETDKVVPMGREWMEWPHRRKYKGWEFVPGQDTDLPNGKRNLWLGWGCDSCQGDVTYLYELLYSVFNGDWKKIGRFLQWLAWPVVNPGGKMHHAWVLWGVKWGGKTLVGLVMKRIYGNGWRLVDDKALHGNFNQWQIGCQFAVLDEAVATDARPDANMMKMLITQSDVNIRSKNVKEYTLTAHDNFLIASNSPRAVSIEGDERRYEVHEVTRMIDHDLAKRIYEWAMSDEGAAALRYHLENDIDLSNFDPVDRAKGSEALEDMKRADWSDLDWEAHYAVELAREAGKGNGICGENLIRVDRLMAVIEEKLGKRSYTALSNSLLKQGAKPLKVRIKSRNIHGERNDYSVWAVDHHSHWLNQTMVAVRDAVEAAREDTASFSYEAILQGKESAEKLLKETQAELAALKATMESVLSEPRAAHVGGDERRPN
jgi:hypothetical protein